MFPSHTKWSGRVVGFWVLTEDYKLPPLPLCPPDLSSQRKNAASALSLQTYFNLHHHHYLAAQKSKFACLPNINRFMGIHNCTYVAPHPLQKISFFWWWRNLVKSSLPSKWGGQERSDRGGTAPHWNSPTFCLHPIYFSCMETFTITQLDLMFVLH